MSQSVMFSLLPYFKTKCRSALILNLLPVLNERLLSSDIP